MSLMGLDRKFLSEYYSDDGTRTALVSKDKYHYIVDKYKHGELVYTELIVFNHPMPEQRAENLAEDWIYEEL